MKIAIIGAGFSGLATAWAFSEQKYIPVEITLFDKQEIGKGTSGISAGLLHPYTGVHAKLSQWGHEGFNATLELLNVSEIYLNASTYAQTGVLRLALQPFQIESFKKTAELYPKEVRWIAAHEMPSFISQAPAVPGIFIKDGVIVYPDNYLCGLWLACKNRGIKLQKEHVISTKALSHFDLVILATGHESSSFQELKEQTLNPTKGQMLELEWPENIPPLPCALNSTIYCVMSQNYKTCLVGATYERDFLSPGPDIGRAKQELLPKLALLYPPLATAKILNCRAGIRVSTPQRMPLIKQIGKRCYAITAMGSKGLLYHAFYAKKLVEQIVVLK